MKNQQIFNALILIGFGAYFFLQQANIYVFQQFYSWPTLFIVVGVSFLLQAYLAKDDYSIVPGVILAGFGSHFHLKNFIWYWPNDSGMFVFILAIGFILRSKRTKTGLFQGILLMVLSLLLLFYDRVATWFSLLENSLANGWRFWPILFVVSGLYLLFFRKK